CVAIVCHVSTPTGSTPAAAAINPNSTVMTCPLRLTGDGAQPVRRANDIRDPDAVVSRDDDDFAARARPAVYEHVDGIGGRTSEVDDRARPDSRQVHQRHLRLSKPHRQRQIDVQDDVQVRREPWYAKSVA